MDMTISQPTRTPWRVLTRITIILLLISWFNPLATTSANEIPPKPLWEVGLTAGGGLVPDYPAADEYHLVGLVLPYVVYRGAIFRAGEGGIARGRFFRNPNYEFDVSLSGSFPSDSDQNDARRGMPDLDFLLEVGPRLRIRLADLTARSRLSLELPVRAVLSVDLSKIGYRGIVFNPRLAYSHRDLFKRGASFKATLGPVFATDPFMDYFYEVEPRFVTPTREAFSADAGYLGTKLSLAVRLPLGRRVRLFTAVQLSYFAGATNEDSPLFRDQANIGVGVGMIWSIFQSKRQAID